MQQETRRTRTTGITVALTATGPAIGIYCLLVTGAVTLALLGVGLGVALGLLTLRWLHVEQGRPIMALSWLPDGAAVLGSLGLVLFLGPNALGVVACLLGTAVICAAIRLGGGLLAAFDLVRDRTATWDRRRWSSVVLALLALVVGLLAAMAGESTALFRIMDLRGGLFLAGLGLVTAFLSRLGRARRGARAVAARWAFWTVVLVGAIAISTALAGRQAFLATTVAWIAVAGGLDVANRRDAAPASR